MLSLQLGRPPVARAPQSLSLAESLQQAQGSCPVSGERLAHPRVSFTWHKHLALLGVTPGLFKSRCFPWRCQLHLTAPSLHASGSLPSPAPCTAHAGQCRADTAVTSPPSEPLPHMPVTLEDLVRITCMQSTQFPMWLNVTPVGTNGLIFGQPQLGVKAKLMALRMCGFCRFT